ncbi:MAG: chemotaxis protein CheB [Candidatus Xenobia bacterium]
MATRRNKAQPDSTAPRAIVALGYSAGGLDPAMEILRELPPDTGLAVVVVQHLDPKHESQLRELLARETRLTVKDAAEGTRLQANEVYVIPPNVQLTVEKGVLHQKPRPPGAPFLVVDTFMKSLAEDQKSHAIGVVLSGVGQDGTLGLAAIKGEGGITLAQEERSARFDSMPRSAISAHAVDFALAPGDIARELVHLARHSLTQPSPPQSEVVLAEEPLKRTFQMLRTLSGLDFSAYKPSTVQRRILRRMLLQKVEELADYVRLLQQQPVELQALYEDLIINVTSFFRDPEAFESLKRTVFPTLVADRPANQPIRIWIPGCSTGEEVYSLAITAIEFLSEHQLPIALQIFATDVNEKPLARARTAIYPDTISTDVSPERLRRFFLKMEGGWQINKTVRDVCIFARQDITHDPPFSHLDLLSCRNVLIYMTPSLQQGVLPIFHYSLRPSGFLLLGSAETVGRFGDLFTLVDKKHKIYARKPVATPHIDFRVGRRDGEPIRNVASPVLPATPQEAQQDVDRLLLERFAPPGVLINQDFEVLQFRGRTGPYLEPAPGHPSFNLLKMAKEPLRAELHATLQKARVADAMTRSSPVRTLRDGHVHLITVEVLPVRPRKNSEATFLCLFLDAAGATTAAVPPETAPPAEPRPEVGELEAELATTRQYLQAIIEEQDATNEELMSANEEIQSANEELQSINEELETAKEELQSTNEELTTVNEEMEERNQELILLNNDLNNLLSSINVPIVIVGPDLRIRRFTPMAQKLLNLISGDVGRPVVDIRHNLELPDLGQFLHQVIDTLIPIERDVQDSAGNWYSMRIRPYKTLDNRIDGAVMVLFEVNDARRSLMDLQRLRKLSEALTEMVAAAVIIVDEHFRCRTVNGIFLDWFRLQEQRPDGVELWTLPHPLFHQAALRSKLEQVTPGTPLDACSVATPDGTFRVSARMVVPTAGDGLMLITFERA